VTPPTGGRPAPPSGRPPSYAADDLLAAVRALAPRFREAEDEVERGRSLTEPLVGAMVDAGLYRLLLPRSLGGGALDPLAYFAVVEALAEVESAAAWSVLISTSTMTSSVRALTDEPLRAMFASPRDAVMAGSAPPRGRAIPVPGGYRLTGQWSQGSNILIAGWVHVGFHVWDGEAPRLGSDGRPVYRQCCFPAAEAKVLDTWHTRGLRGTGCHYYWVT
jgi:alkylation response protein AidB-like acyl-CoA dehydrogenase